MRVTPRRTRTAAFVFALSAPAPVFAYMGPDIGVGGLEAALGVAGSLALVLIFMAWYPLKRLNRRVRARTVRPDLAGLGSSYRDEGQ